MRRLTSGDDIDQLFKDGLLRIEHNGQFLKVNKIHEGHGFINLDFKSGKARMTHFYSKGGSRDDLDVWVMENRKYIVPADYFDRVYANLINEIKQSQMKQTVINLTEGMTAKVEGGKLIVSEPDAPKNTQERFKAGDVVNAGDGTIFLYKDGYTSGSTSYAALFRHAIHVGASVHNYGFKQSTHKERAMLWATDGGAISPEDVDGMRIRSLVVRFDKGRDVVIESGFIGPGVHAIIKSMIAQHNEEIAELEKEFSEL